MASGCAPGEPSLGLSSVPFTGMYEKKSKTGLACNLATILEYQLATKMCLGGTTLRPLVSPYTPLP